MNIAQWTIQYKTFSLVVLCLILIGGALSYQKLGRLEDPEFTIKEAVVTTLYPGATALEVEEEVADRIETAIQQLGQLKEVRSISKPGVSIVTAEIKDNYDATTLPQVWDELRRKVGDVQKQLPPGAEPSIVNDDFGDVYGILLAIRGEGYSYRELKKVVDFLQDELLLVQDVAKVTVWGEQQEQIYVEVSRAKLNQLGIAYASVMRTLSQQNIVTSSGKVDVGDYYLRIEPTGAIDSVDAISNLVIQGGDKLIYLKDFASVYRGYQEPMSKHLRFNGEQAIALGLSTVKGGNVVTMGEAVKQRLAQLQAQIPYGIHIDHIYYQSDGVSQSVKSFIVNLTEAIAIVIIVLMLFMGFKSACLIGLSLLLTVCGTFIIMHIYGIQLQRISLGALIIALGMLVDNAIVVTDGILVRIQQKQSHLDAIKAVVSQSMWPLFGATLIAILAFAAIGLSQDSTGEYTRSLFQVILISLSLSWVVAITLTPLLCVLFLKAPTVANSQDPYQGLMFRLYKPLLNISIRFRYVTIIIVLTLLAGAFYLFQQLEDSFFPDSTNKQFYVHYWLPEGTAIERTSTDLKQIEQHILAQDSVVNVSTFVGAGAPRFMLVYAPEKSYDSYGLLLVEVDDYRQIDKLMKGIKNYLKESFVDSNPKIEKIRLGPGGGYLIEGRFSGPDPNQLRALSSQAEAILRADRLSTGVRNDWRQRVAVIKPIVNEPQARKVGMTRQDIASALQTNFVGQSVGVYREHDNLIPIVLRAPQQERQSVDDLDYVLLTNKFTADALPIRQVITKIETDWEDSIIQRKNKKRTIMTQADPNEGNASVLFARVREAIESIPLPADYVFEWGGEYENSQNARSGLNKNLPLTLVLMVLVTIGLFNAFKQPLIIWLIVPLALIGVSFGLFMTKQSFGFMALLGFLSLTGMLIKNAIVLLDEVDIQQRQQPSLLAAIQAASVSRLRPVLMAAATTILGMIPLLSDVFFVAMAVTIMSGLLFATLLTMIVVPVLCSFFYRETALGLRDN